MEALSLDIMPLESENRTIIAFDPTLIVVGLRVKGNEGKSIVPRLACRVSGEEGGREVKGCSVAMVICKAGSGYMCTLLRLSLNAVETAEVIMGYAERNEVRGGWYVVRT